MVSWRCIPNPPKRRMGQTLCLQLGAVQTYALNPSSSFSSSFFLRRGIHRFHPAARLPSGNLPGQSAAPACCLHVPHNIRPAPDSPGSSSDSPFCSPDISRLLHMRDRFPMPNSPADSTWWYYNEGLILSLTSVS